MGYKIIDKTEVPPSRREGCFSWQSVFDPLPMNKAIQFEFDGKKKFADAVIEESVNKKALEGLVKGGLVTPQQARDCGVVSMSYAYIVRT